MLNNSTKIFFMLSIIMGLNSFSCSNNTSYIPDMHVLSIEKVILLQEIDSIKKTLLNQSLEIKQKLNFTTQLKEKLLALEKLNEKIKRL
jgi:hypothetical protein